MTAWIKPSNKPKSRQYSIFKSESEQCPYLQLVSDKDDGLAAQLLLNCIVKDVVAHMGI